MEDHPSWYLVAKPGSTVATFVDGLTIAAGLVEGVVHAEVAGRAG